MSLIVRRDAEQSGRQFVAYHTSRAWLAAWGPTRGLAIERLALKIEEIERRTSDINGAAWMYFQKIERSRARAAAC